MAGALPNYPLTLVQGETLKLRVQLKDEAEQVMDLTGYTAKYGFTTSTGAQVFSNVPAIDGVADTIQVLVPGATTAAWAVGDYVHELRVTDPTGVVEVLFQGNLRIEQART